MKINRSKIRCAMAGPCLDEKGGISAVAKNIIANETTVLDIDFIYIASWGSGLALNRVAGFVASAVRLIKLCALRRIDVLHLHTASRGSFVRKYTLSLVSRLFGVPYVIHLHGAGFHEFYRDTWLRRQIISYFHHADSVIVLGEWWKNWVENTIRNTPTVTTVRNGVPSSLELDPSLSAARELDGTRLLFLGRLGKRKGLVDLLRALATLRAEQPGLRFNLAIGGDGDWQPFQDLVNSLGLQDSVRYLGWVDGDEKLRLIDGATVFVLPSYNEGLPVAIVESLARGLPVISTTVGSIPDVVEDGKEGWLIRPGDEVALKEALLSAAIDQPLLREMRKNAFKKYKQILSLEGQMVEILAVYRRVLSKSVSAR
ncbi:glycosyltransferase family 4 protein [Cupriavidus sp. CV2]|uniref:glycosyltransferase family 4 protein n=1 Tax=Cupriavidus ulmosensis TaxID=3065913 RepID=UPI00296A91E3|nr:glycosyltransferase family 4 protein [Cupriavidus sp. CV2]MDW3686382.1 glycosyltransferase family 4 protein [Cupriavidus sp. CV2]